MEKENISIFDMIYDENNNQDIVLYNDKKEPTEFEQIAFIPIEERDFVILRPVKPMDGLREDEALVYEMVEEDEEERFILVVDDEQIDKVFSEYDKLYDELNGKQ